MPCGMAWVSLCLLCVCTHVCVPMCLAPCAWPQVFVPMCVYPCVWPHVRGRLQVHKGCDPRAADVVLAADIVWLKELIQPLARTIHEILTYSPTATDTGSATATATGRPTAAATEGCPKGHSDTACLTETCASAYRREGSQPLSEAGQENVESRSSSRSSGDEKIAFIAFGERASPNSTLFISLEEVCDAFRACGCRAETAVRRVMEREPGERMPVVLLRITALE
jgi:hypothetical protein